MDTSAAFQIEKKISSGERLTHEEGLFLLQEAPLVQEVADVLVRTRTEGPS